MKSRCGNCGTRVHGGRRHDTNIPKSNLRTLNPGNRIVKDKDDKKDLSPYVIYTSHMSRIESNGEFSLPFLLQSMKSGNVFRAKERGIVRVERHGEFTMSVNGIITKGIAEGDIPWQVTIVISATTLQRDMIILAKEDVVFNRDTVPFRLDTISRLEKGTEVFSFLIVKFEGTLKRFGYITQAQMSIYTTDHDNDHDNNHS